MIALLAFVPLLYAGGFAAGREPFSPVDAAYLRPLARPCPALLGHEREVLRAFRSGRTRITHSMCLAARLQGGWLYADQAGAAVYAGRTGAFDVLAWERLLRREPSLHGVFRSGLARLIVVNRTSARLTLTDGVGFLRARVSPRAQAVATTWYSPHKLCLAGRPIGTVDDVFEDFLPSKGVLTRVRFEHGVSGLGQGPVGTGRVDDFTLIVTDS